MTRSEYSAAAHDLIYLVGCALNGNGPDSGRVEKMDLDTLFVVAKKHMLTACAAETLARAGVTDARFAQEALRAIDRSVRFDHYREKIIECFERDGIWYLPLKGAILCNYYPAPYMREMTDNDILIDPKRRADARAIMESLGFRTLLYGNRVDDGYVIEREGVAFELHAALFGELEAGAITEYYRDVTPLLIKDSDNSFGCHLSNEDFLVYFFAHEYKHFITGGTGIRSLADVYVMRRRFADSLDEDRVKAELEKMSISDHARSLCDLSFKLFSPTCGKKLDGQERELLEFIIFSGAYGTVDNFVAERLKTASEGSKMSAVRRLVSLSEGEMKSNYPFFYRHKPLRPLLTVYRFGRALTVSRKKAAAEFKAMKKREKNQK